MWFPNKRGELFATTSGGTELSSVYFFIQRQIKSSLEYSPELLLHFQSKWKLKPRSRLPSDTSYDLRTAQQRRLRLLWLAHGSTTSPSAYLTSLRLNYIALQTRLLLDASPPIIPLKHLARFLWFILCAPLVWPFLNPLEHIQFFLSK